MLERDPASGGAYVLPTTPLSRHNLFCKTLCFPGNLFSLAKVEFCPLGCICIFFERPLHQFIGFSQRNYEVIGKIHKEAQVDMHFYGKIYENLIKQLHRPGGNRTWSLLIYASTLPQFPRLTHYVKPLMNLPLVRIWIVRNSSSILSSSPPTPLCKYFGYSGSELTCWLSLRTLCLDLFCIHPNWFLFQIFSQCLSGYKHLQNCFLCV